LYAQPTGAPPGILENLSFEIQGYDWKNEFGGICTFYTDLRNMSNGTPGAAKGPERACTQVVDGNRAMNVGYLKSILPLPEVTD
jgi:hypothetical protein